MELAPETEHTALPTVRDVLALPELQVGRPEVIAGSRGLDREIRWAHVAAGRSAATLLDGGELILTTGEGWPSDPTARLELAEILVTASGAADGRGIAALVLELGHAFTEAPHGLIHSCEAHGVPLIVLHREVRFVQITQRVHQRILAAQNEALRARADVHAMLTDLGLNRSPVDYVVEQLAETLDAPVVLEDPMHRIVAFSAHGSDTVGALAPWSAKPGAEPEFDRTTERVPVEARGSRWGTLTALPGPPHPAGRRTVLELGAFALALGRLADAEGDQWLEFGSKRVFDLLLGGRYRNDAELSTQLAAAGLPLDGREIIAATVRGMGDFGAHGSLERAILETAVRRAVAPGGRVLIAPEFDEQHDGEAPALLALISLPLGDATGVTLTAGSADHWDLPGSASLSGDETPPLARRLAHELDMLVPGPTPESWRAHLALASPVRRLRQVITSLEQLRAAGPLPASSRVGRVTVQEVQRQPLAHLIRSLSAVPEVQEFATDALAPLIEHDRTRSPGHPGDLVAVLSAYLAHPTNRSLAADQARLSRSVFYQRLALIEDLLGVDLADGETIATLTVALLSQPA